MKHFLVTTDFSADSMQAFAVANEQIQLCGDCRITLLAVLEDVAPTSVQFEFGLSLIDTKGVLEEAQAQATKKIEELRQQYFANCSAEAVIVRAARGVATEIAEYAKTNRVDMIIMTTHGRTGIKRLLMGSVSEGVLRESPCPLLIVPIRETAA